MTGQKIVLYSLGYLLAGIATFCQVHTTCLVSLCSSISFADDYEHSSKCLPISFLLGLLLLENGLMVETPSGGNIPFVTCLWRNGDPNFDQDRFLFLEPFMEICRLFSQIEISKFM